MEQDSLAAEQLHRMVEQGLVDEQPYLIIFRTSSGAGDTSGGSGSGTNMLEVWSRDHPYSTGSNSGGLGSSEARQIAAW